MEGEPYSKPTVNGAGLNDLLRKCYEILGLKENASEDEIRRAVSGRRAIGRGAQGEGGPWEKLKEVAWARDTLLDFLRAQGTLPASGADPEEIAYKTPVPQEGPAYPPTEPTGPDHGWPWWWSSAPSSPLPFFSRAFSMYTNPRPARLTKGKLLPRQGICRLSGRQPLCRAPGLLQGHSRVAPDVKKAVVTLRFGTRLGSGFLVSKDGYLVTNFHVVDAVKGSAQFSTGDAIDVNIVKIAPESDFALLKTASGSGYPFLPLGDSSACREGEAVIAVGSPQGLQSTFTKGIVSAKDRRFAGSAVSFIQTDAAINHGNSGGPLINAAGQVIGINSRTVEKFVAEGLNFAIAINDVKGLIEDGRRMSETERTREASGIEAAIRREERKKESQEQQSRERIINSRREEERRYGEQVEAMKEHLEKMQKGQVLDRCLGEAARQADRLWNEQCTTLSRSAGCQLPANIADNCRGAFLNAQQECLKSYGE